MKNVGVAENAQTLAVKIIVFLISDKYFLLLKHCVKIVFIGAQRRGDIGERGSGELALFGKIILSCIGQKKSLFAGTAPGHRQIQRIIVQRKIFKNYFDGILIFIANFADGGINRLGNTGRRNRKNSTIVTLGVVVPK